MTSTILPRRAAASQSPQSDSPVTWAELPAAWRLRLSNYGILSASDWRELRASARSRLFGITRSMREILDIAAQVKS
jgi:hypothetical protein